jgi:hypothetical protein
MRDESHSVISCMAPATDVVCTLAHRDNKSMAVKANGCSSLRKMYA